MINDPPTDEEKQTLLARKAAFDALDDHAAKAEELYKLLEQYLPEAAAGVREMYELGMIKGLRAIRGVTVHEIRFGLPEIPMTNALPLSRICSNHWKPSQGRAED